MYATGKCEAMRSALKNWLEGLSDERKAQMKQTLMHVGNSGRTATGEQSVPRAGVSPEQHCWDVLLQHLSDRRTDLGWECFAALSGWRKANVLLCVQLHQTCIYQTATKKAKANWKKARAEKKEEEAADRQGKQRPGGSWIDVDFSSEFVLIPRRMNENWPFIVLFYRSQMDHTIRVVDKRGTEETTTEGGLGHFESLVAHLVELPDVPHNPHVEWAGWFEPDDPEYEHLKHIGTRYLGAQYSDLARVRMANDYSSQLLVEQYQYLNAVGLRMATIGKNAKTGNKRAKGQDILPCIIIGIRLPTVTAAAAARPR